MNNKCVHKGYKGACDGCRDCIDDWGADNTFASSDGDIYGYGYLRDEDMRCPICNREFEYLCRNRQWGEIVGCDLCVDNVYWDSVTPDMLVL